MNFNAKKSTTCPSCKTELPRTRQNWMEADTGTFHDAACRACVTRREEAMRLIPPNMHQIRITEAHQMRKIGRLTHA